MERDGWNDSLGAQLDGAGKPASIRPCMEQGGRPMVMTRAEAAACWEATPRLGPVTRGPGST